MITSFDVSRITLGAVQLGLHYGAVPTSTMPDDAEAQDLLTAAWAGGINTVDTARTYGVSEERIGRWLSENDGPLTIATKFPELPADPVSGPEALKKHLTESRIALGGAPIQYYLAHHAPDILRSEIQDTLRAMRSAGHIDGFGASVYTETEAEAALSVPDLATMQMPISLADQRFVEVGLVKEAAAQDVAVFARSVFLQGVLLREPTKLPALFAPAMPCLTKFSQCCRDVGVSKLTAALIGVERIPGVTSLVIGINRQSQLDEIRSALLESKQMDEDVLNSLKDTMTDFPADLKDPRDW